ncbi:MAG: hypothetical protein KC910_25755 [Candidatus Eremiobacteraeota bacterium]|nr:hypothetical protein [Candidatus Eremiobacteraeota bacterium]
MVTCPQCGTQARAGKQFCGSCGGSLVGVPSQAGPSTGKGKISLDKDTINILLAEFANRDGMTFSYHEGRLLVDQGSVKVTVTHLPLKSTRLELDVVGQGAVTLEVDDCRLETESVDLDLTVGLPSRG